MNSFDRRIELKAVVANHEQFMSFIEENLLTTQIDITDRMQIMMSCEELITNVCSYAYPQGEGNLEIMFGSDSTQISISFIDAGKQFNPIELPDADTTLPLNERELGGLGILMVKKLMDDVKYQYTDEKNQTTIIKRIK